MNPHSLESEKAVLGAVLLDNDILSAVAPIISDTDFYRAGNAILFRAMQTLESRNEPIDTVSLANLLKTDGMLDKVGGTASIADLTHQVPSVSHAESHAKKVAEYARRRSIIHAANHLAESAQKEEIEKSLADFEASIADSDKRVDGSCDLRSLLNPAMNQLESLFKGEKPTTIPTGFYDLDAKCPLCPGDMVLVGGRPGMGKTALGLNIALQAAANGTPTLFLSVEMPKHQIVQRAISALSGMPASKFRKGGVTTEDLTRVGVSMTKMMNYPLWIYDRGTMTVHQAVSEATRLARKQNVQLVILDHVHQLHGKGNRLEVISEASHALKSCAIDNKQAVIVLAQLNRGVESRMPPRPNQSDLKESGELEQVADSVWLLYRQDYYEEKSLFQGTKQARDSLVQELRGLGLVLIDKSRHGETGSVKLVWDGKTTSYKNNEWRR